MHPYLKHLLHDIKNAEKGEDETFGRPEPKTFLERMEEMERFVSGEGAKPLSYFSDLRKQDFPPSEQLSEADIETVLDEFDKMLSTWNATISYPSNMPMKDRYDFLINHVLEDDFTPVNHGHIGFDYCTGYAPDCTWGEYCHCLEYWEEEMGDG